jgi:phenylpropionate dioxygenase-like ring-hydroxylating dioxygenase large terminal subunit
MHITPELNERLVRVGPGTPMGEVFRRYWVPACLSEEIAEPDSPPIRVRILGEDLVAFRDSSGEVGLVAAYCAHRLAPLFYGRNEECGLRCVYHGWKFDTQGNCVDMPSEPPYSKFRLRVSIKAYPTYEAGKMIWTYMGPTREMPAPPNYEWLHCPGDYLRVSKSGEHCNWLQATEGGIDTAHSSFLHNNDLTAPGLRQRDPHPTLEVDDQPWGFTYGSLRNISDDQTFVRVYQYFMPAQSHLAGMVNGATGAPTKHPHVGGHVWVPIDDENTWVYNRSYHLQEGDPYDPEEWPDTGERPGEGYRRIPGTYWLLRNKSNDYLVDREVQRTKTFSGIEGVNTQDFALQSALGGGYIVDRSLEALGSSDNAIQACRRLLAEALDDVEAGRPPRGSDPETHNLHHAAEAIIPRGAPWRDLTKDLVLSNWV